MLIAVLIIAVCALVVVLVSTIIDLRNARKKEE